MVVFLGILSVMSLLSTLALAFLLMKAKGRPDDAAAETARLKAELEQERAVSSSREKACAERLADGEKACGRLLAEKDESCRRALAAKDAACADAIAERERACKETVEVRQKACDEMLAERDAALKRKEEDCRKALRDKDATTERLIAETEKKFAETLTALRENFGNLAASKIREQQNDLTVFNRTQMEQVVKPLRDQLLHLQELAQKTQDGNASLEKSMCGHVEAIGKIADSLSGVASALSSNTRYQGRKGEEILAEKLRQAGLEENVNFFLQKGTDSDRPDAQVCDTENRWLVIDSKVSLTAYMEYMDAADERTKAEKLAAHVASVRQKIDQLAKKKYPKVFSEEHRDRNYLPITAMFVAYEAPLMAALQVEPSLWQFAAQNNVVLITPLTLLAYLRLVYLAWQHEKEARNQQAIVDTARELLKRTNDFLKTFEDVGDAMEHLQDTYTKARGVFLDAPRAHSIANSARKLIDLHVRLESKKGRRIERAECLNEPEEDSAPSEPAPQTA